MLVKRKNKWIENNVSGRDFIYTPEEYISGKYNIYTKTPDLINRMGKTGVSFRSDISNRVHA